MSQTFEQFSNNCNKAISMLLMFEKALSFDRSNCAKKIVELQNPREFEQEWKYICDIWLTFYHENYVDLSKINTPCSISPKYPTTELHNSEQVRTFIKSIHDSIRLSLYPENNHDTDTELKEKFRYACDKAAALLDNVERISNDEKGKRVVQLENIVFPKIFAEAWEFVKTIFKTFLYKGFVNTRELPHSPRIKFAKAPYPIKDVSGVQILIRSIGDKISIPKNVSKTNNTSEKTSSGNKRRTSCKKVLLKRTDGNTTKDLIQNRYIDLINCIVNTYNTISSLHGNNSTFTKIQDGFFSRLDELLSKAEADMTHALQNTVWDNLVVAFFGETNAGKSTIIETFRILYDNKRKQSLKKGIENGEDGLIIGDGRPDFTKVYEEYKMEVEGRPFTLIDVPGIEGNEDDFIDDIKKALMQAHIVFYVQGHNIKPDVATASKIKKYLSDWVNVYSVYNVRGGAFNYRKDSQRNNLISGDVAQAEILIKESFPNILGDVYKGNISLQGLLALCSVANFSPTRNDLIETQSKILNQFGSSEELFKFSQFRNITRLTSQKAANFNEEITEANKQKLMSLGKHFISEINSEMDLQSKTTEKFSEELKSYKRDLSQIFIDTKNKLKNRLHGNCEILFSKLQRDINDVIDVNRYNSDIEKGIEELIDNFSIEFSDSTNSIINEEFLSMSHKLQQKQRSLDCYKVLNGKLHTYDIIPETHFDINKAIEDMSISFSEIASTITGAALGAIVGAFFGGVGAIPGALIGAGLDNLRKAIFGDGGKSKAKDKMKKELDNVKIKTQSILNDTCSNINASISEETERTERKVKEDIVNLGAIQDTLTKAKQLLNSEIININKASYGKI